MGAKNWGVWERDPGPRGIPFDQFSTFASSTTSHTELAPAGWEINSKDFWLEEHGIWMETPLPSNLQPGQHLVTGGRSRTSVLTIYPTGNKGEKRWSLDGGVSHIYHAVALVTL